MSRSLDIADAIAARLKQVATLPGLSIIVWRQQELQAEVDRLVMRNSGMALVIAFLGFDNPNGQVTGQATVTRRYSLAILAKPVLLHRTAPTATDAAETAARALHNWDIEDPTTGAAEISVTSCELEPDPDLLNYTLTLEVISRL